MVVAVVAAAVGNALPAFVGCAGAVGGLAAATAWRAWALVPRALLGWPVAWVVHLALRRPRPRPWWVVTWLDGVMTTGLNRLAGGPLDLQRPGWGEPPPGRAGLSGLA